MEGVDDVVKQLEIDAEAAASHTAIRRLMFELAAVVCLIAAVMVLTDIFWLAAERIF
jgi:hypothetical protein